MIYTDILSFGNMFLKTEIRISLSFKYDISNFECNVLLDIYHYLM